MMEDKNLSTSIIGTSRQSRKASQKRSLANYVGSIKEGLRKIGGCQDVQETAKPKLTTVKETLSKGEEQKLIAYTTNNHQQTEQECNSINKVRRTRNKSDKKVVKSSDSHNQLKGFDEFHVKVPGINSMERTQLWLHHTDLTSDSSVSLSYLPIRGTLLPNKYTADNNYPYFYDDDIVTQVSSCESARGTHGRGTPPTLDPKTLRLDELFQQLQSKQEREARQMIIASGQQHLLSFNLLDVYSHQVAGMPIGTTPEILPFMAPPTHSSFNNPKYVEMPSRKQPHLLEDRLSFQYPCKWSSCWRRFDSAESLFGHVDQAHIQAYTRTATNAEYGRITCKWDNCNQTYHARYKLLLHVHNHHCRPTEINSSGTMRGHHQSMSVTRRCTRLSNRKESSSDRPADEVIWPQPGSKRKRNLRKHY